MTETLFKKVDYTLGKLLDDIEMGTIGLPDIQRPFVWKNAKVRDLLDSLYRGYPVGYFLFWQNGNDGSSKPIGTQSKQKQPDLLIVDGQQRLTSLYAVIKGVPVLRENYQQESIEIAFHAIEGTFEVSDAAIRKDAEYVPNVSVVWAKNANLFEMVDAYTARLKKQREATGGALDGEEIKRIQNHFTRLCGLISFPFTTLELASTVDDERVAEIFVRTNSKGKVLNQSDFILTLMSVFWEEGRSKLEEFCSQSHTPSKGKASPFNHFITPKPEHLLRASIGLGFRRARLKYGYALLRGKDLETEQFSVAKREEQFGILKEVQSTVLNLQHWHDFLKTLQVAGFRRKEMISSQTTVIYCYTLYLIGKRDFGVDRFTLSNLMARWFFMTLLTGRYTKSSESALERDFADLRSQTNSQQFSQWIEKSIAAEFTEDFWNITLPNRMDTSSANTPSLNAYYAAMNLLDAKALYSNKKISDLLDPAHQAKKSAVETHHLFPKKYLTELGISDKRLTNQIANFALLEWDDNVAISGSPPSNYVPKYSERFDKIKLKDMNYWHALPVAWESLDYHEFLQQRRKLMARVIRDGFARIGGTDSVS